MSLYVRVVDDEVKDCWDTPPQEGVGNNGWQNAIEVRPNIIPYRQRYAPHTFDLTKDPVEIVYAVIDITIDERKADMVKHANFIVEKLVRQMLRDGATLDTNAIASAQDAVTTRTAAIEAATTHDELDTLVVIDA
jgi:hypothetical protein